MATLKKNFPVEGLGCAACVERVRGAIKDLKGVEDVSVSLASNIAQVEYDPAVVKAPEIRQAVRDAGYDLVIPEDYDFEDEQNVLREDAEAELEERARKKRRKELRRLKFDMYLAIVIAAVVMLLVYAFKDFPYKDIVLFVLATISVFWCGRRFISTAARQASHMTATMDTLVSLSTIVAWGFSTFSLLFPKVWSSQGLTAPIYFESCALIVAFILIGRVLEEDAKNGTNESVRKLMDLQPEKNRVSVGDTVKVKPGARIPVDGVVVDGETYVDESLLTGEPMAVFKGVGAKVYTGTVNTNGLIRVRAEKTGSDTMLSSIIKMVRDAQASRSKIQGIVDKVATIFVPVVLVIALAAFVYWSFFAGDAGGFAKGILTMVAVLVIACPCSLGLATPTALIAGIGKAAEKGILIKDADTLQVARSIDTVVLDKTGTLTVGTPTVTDEYWYDPATKGILKAMELGSSHPIASAIVEELKEVTPSKIEDFAEVPGKGVEASYDDMRYFVGNTTSETSLAGQQWEKEGKTVFYFSDQDRLLAVFAVSDEPKESSKEAVLSLGEMGIETVMLTGDRQEAAMQIASKVGISRVMASMLPGDKAQFITELQGQKKKVAMVGDGINDSAALAGADLSIAMGKGSDIAMDTSMVTVVSSELTKIPYLVNLSKKTVKIIWENLGWAFLYNVIAIPAACGLFKFSVSPALAAGLMALSSVLVVTNSLRLKKD